MTTDLDHRAATTSVLYEVEDERRRQDERWGVQDHPWSPGPNYGGDYATSVLGIPTEEDARSAAHHSAKHGYLTFSEILLEEFAEAVAAPDDAAAREELIQVAAVAVAAVEAIDRSME